MNGVPGGSIKIRDAVPDDRPAMAAILAANDEPVDWANLPGWPYLDHLLDRGRTVVAVRDGRSVGFGTTIRVGQLTHVSDLFVDPGQHGGGIGRALMAALRGQVPDDPWTTFSSADQRALALYLRAGMRPWWPNLYMIANGPVAGLAGDASLATAVEVDDAALIEYQLSGLDRGAEYRFWGSLPAAVAVSVSDRDRDGDRGPIAVGIATGMRSARGLWLKHLSMDRATGDREAATAVGSVLAYLASTAGSGATVGLCIPGPHPATPALLEAGFRIFDRDTFCATDPGVIDPTRDVPDASFL
jgi:GNAT superfamily N-acetyltransferase